ncbi:hypothetical protein BDQ17DRAFT_1333211 [Cyathus striatus]|nr:hypothetical protein BDQ17DRAFT_1333211 [Cyathus striatus]
MLNMNSIPDETNVQEEDITLISSTERSGDHNTIARKIWQVLREYEQSQGTSTGLNRMVRQLTKPAYGGGMSKGKEGEAGNTANARLAAETTAGQNIKRRRLEFSALSPSELFATARISAVAPLNNQSYGVVVAKGQLLLGKVITMYEKGAGKGGKYNWVSSSNNVGAISYIAMQVWRQLRIGHRHFHANSVQEVPQNNSIMEMRSNTFTQTNIGISEQKDIALSAVKRLAMRKKHTIDD